MLRFQTYEGDGPATSWPLRNAYLLGVDGNAVRADIRFHEGQLLAEHREQGTVSLALQHKVDHLGELTLQTCLLPDRDEPYLLEQELARHRLMMLYNKLEEWSMFDMEREHPAIRRFDKARELFVESLCLTHDQPAEASAKSREALILAIDGSEELALGHSQLLLNRRKLTGALPGAPFGCGVRLDQDNPRLRGVLSANFDYVQLPMPWRVLAPEEGAYRWEKVDEWIGWARGQGLRIVAGPLVALDPRNLPDWLYIWEHDYDTLRDLVYEHVELVVGRYAERVDGWIGVSGLHVNGHFTFNFEQLMDLTRMTAMLVKKVDPRGRLTLELTEPFGEYYATNPRSIPPQMYAELLVQSGIPFDTLGLRMPMGQAVSGQHVRDLMQIGGAMDQFAALGKPLRLTVAAPAEPVTHLMIANPGSDEPADDRAGNWRVPWSPTVQSHWLEAVFQLALARPFVEAVAWQGLQDHPEAVLPMSGLVAEDAVVRGAFRRLVHLRRTLMGLGPHPTAPPAEGTLASAASVPGQLATPGLDEPKATATAPVKPAMSVEPPSGGPQRDATDPEV